MKNNKLLLVIFIIVMIGIGGCGSGSNDNKITPAPILAECNKSIGGGGGGSGEMLSNLNVGTGNRPQYSWLGDDVEKLTLVRVSDPSVIVWEITTRLNNNISSPVTHGTVPAGAVETSQDETTLEFDVTYKISISKTSGLYEYVEFTPKGESSCPSVTAGGGGNGGTVSNNSSLVGTWILVEVQEGGNSTNLPSGLGERLVFTDDTWTFSSADCWNNGSYFTDGSSITYTPPSSSMNGSGYCYAIDATGGNNSDSYQVDLNTLIITKSNSDYYKFEKI